MALRNWLARKEPQKKPQLTLPSKPQVFQPVKWLDPYEGKPLIGDALRRGWAFYGLARGTFIKWGPTPYYAHEGRRVEGVCAVVAIYLALSGASIRDVEAMGYQAAEFGITRLTGINYAYVYAPAVASTEYTSRGALVPLLSHLMTLTDSGWPMQEIVAWAYVAEQYHRAKEREKARPQVLIR